MRVFILGIDALEYHLVHKWKLHNLMQMKHGMLQIPQKYYATKDNVPYTPLIWTTIITGKSPEEHGIREWWSYGRILDAIRTKPPFIWVKNKRKILMKLGLKPHVIQKQDWKQNTKTIFDEVKPSIPLFIPAYNDPSEYHIKLSETMLNKGLKEYIKTIWWLHNERKKTLFKTLKENKDWKLFMVWFDGADLLGHVCWHKCLDDLIKMYFDLDDLVNQIKSMLQEPYYFLILSDHGMQDSGDGVTGNHSDHAFWSQNINDWVPRDFTDYYKKVISMVKK